MSVFPVNRVPDILKRMDLNSSQAEAMKTCFGILAIMSREDSNKLLIAKDGMEIILNAMTVHVDRTDVQEAGCDLLWSLAFNSSAVKDIIAKYGGSVVLVRALKRHSRSADFLKSACGALSNMCQSKLNQEGVSSQGGLQPLVGSIHVHQTNAKLLPFIFDAIASIIVNNEENARTVSSLGIVPVVVASLSRHKSGMEVVKSGCHTLAILSDVKGQASKIAFAGGVPIILSLLDTHPLYSDLHRVAAVVLLRMLQESAHVGREITCHEGVRILLNSLEKGGAQQDTVAAVTHILYTVTNPSSPASSAIESQLWLPVPANAVAARAIGGAGSSMDGAENSPSVSQRKQSLHSLEGANGSGNNLTSLLSAQSAGAPSAISSGPQGATALSGVVMILGQYSSRRDVVRAACRLINNLSGFVNVVTALDRLGVLDKIFECASIHRDTKDVIDSATSLIKTIHKRAMPVLQVASPPCIQGLVHVFRCKLADEDATTACLDTMTRLIETTYKQTVSPDKRREYEDARMIDGKLWEHCALTTSLTILQNVIEAEKELDTNAGRVAVTSSTPTGKVLWNKGSAKVVASVLSFIETVYHTHKLNADAIIYKETADGLNALLRIMPFKSTDLTRRIEKILPLIESVARHQLLDSKSPGLGSKKSLLSLKPPLPSNTGGEEGGFLFNGVPMRRATPASDDGSVTNASSCTNLATIAGQQASSSGPSPLTLNRKVKELSTPTAADINNRDSPLSADMAENGLSRTFSKSRSWNTSLNTLTQGQYQEEQGEKGGVGVVTTTSTSPKKILPQHPLKKKGGGGGMSSFPSNTALSKLGAAPVLQAPQQRLLENWPNYLERLSLSPNLSANRGYLNPTGQDSSTPSRMQLSYESSSAGGRGVLSKCPTPVPYIVPPNGLGEPFEHSLTFDSDFESGNLLRAVQKGDANYDLFLRSDLHTPGHTQWFYFAIANTHPPELVRLAEQGVDVPPVRVRFNIVNFTKPDSLFNLGMRPVVYSVQDAQKKNIGWVRAGSDISYYGNSFLRNNTAGEGLAYYYTLSFTLELHNPHDTVLIAYSYPYTMSDYRSHLSEMLDKPGASDVIRQFRLCQTLSGEDCDLLVITNYADKERERIGPINLQSVDMNGSDLGGFAGATNSKLGAGRNSKNSSKQQLQLKPALFLSCRVHPGETPASWMMKGMLEFLTSDCSQAVLLRQVFVIFIVPMLNPDGVIFGNNRCSLSGVDLNRQWKLPIKSIHPTIFHLKYFMMAQRKLRDITMYIDLHGHSRKYNVFMYGCDDKKRPRPQVRAFPRFFSMHNVGKKYVCYADCSFTVKKGRESTARVVVAKEINIPCSFTLEATFCGSNYGPLKHCHMNIGHMQEVGSALCDAILNFSISEGQVKDTMLVPANLRAVAQVEKAIAMEGLGGNADAMVDYGSGGNSARDSARESTRESARDRSNSNTSAIEKSESSSSKRSTSRKVPSAAAGDSAGYDIGTPTGDADTDGNGDFEVNPDNAEGDSSSRTDNIPGSGRNTAVSDTRSEDCEDNTQGAAEVVEGDTEEVGSGSDESDADGSDNESFATHDAATVKSRAESLRSEAHSVDTSRLRINSLGPSIPAASSLAISTLPGMSKVLTASGRQTIMSGGGSGAAVSPTTADKINSIRALTTPSTVHLRLNNTLSPSGPGGALTGRMLKSDDMDSLKEFAYGDATDGIASLQLTGSNIGGGASGGAPDSLFSKSKKTKKKKGSSKEKASGGSSRKESTTAGSRKKIIKDSLSQTGASRHGADDMDLLEASMGGSLGGTLSSGLTGLGGTGSLGEDKQSILHEKYLSSSTPTAMSMSSAGQGRGNMLSASARSTSEKKGGGAGGTIVKAEFQDMFFRNDMPSLDNNNNGDSGGSSLAKTQAVATPFGLPKVNGAQK